MEKDKVKEHIKTIVNDEMFKKKIGEILISQLAKIPNWVDYDISYLNLHDLYFRDKYILQQCACDIEHYENCRLYEYQPCLMEERELPSPLKELSNEKTYKEIVKWETTTLISKVSSLQEMVDIIRNNFSGERKIYRLQNDTYRYCWKYIYVFQSEEVFKNYLWNPLEGGEFRIMT